MAMCSADAVALKTAPQKNASLWGPWDMVCVMVV
jgi:hypothetical protein